MNKKLSQNSQRSLNIALRDFSATTGLDINNLTQNSVEEWDRSMIARDLSVSTRRQRLSLISQKKPSIDFPLPEREQPTQHYLLKEQIAQLFSAFPKNLAGHLDFLLFSLFLLTGRRNSQIRNLHWDQLIQNDGLFFIEKEDR